MRFLDDRRRTSIRIGRECFLSLSFAAALSSESAPQILSKQMPAFPPLMGMLATSDTDPFSESPLSDSGCFGMHLRRLFCPPRACQVRFVVSWPCSVSSRTPISLPSLQTYWHASRHRHRHRPIDSVRHAQHDIGDYSRRHRTHRPSRCLADEFRTYEYRSHGVAPY